jgi:DNA-binding NarL/FixJ family response regulator
MNDRKKILVVEDEETLRSSLVVTLNLRGFDAEGSPNVSAARSLISQLRDKIDVMVLDMSLKDNQYPNITGADLGLEARKIIPKWPPEFLILSSHRPSDYYEAALKLDVAAYLVKERVDHDDVIRHVRSLCLRRALSFDRKEIAEKIAEIAESSPTPTEAVVGFCRKMLAPEMQACIAAPSVFLLTDEKGTQNCGGDADLPSGYDEGYTKVQALAQGAVNHSDPFVFNKDEVGEPSDEQTLKIYERLDGAAFLPLFIVHGLRLSMGILKSDDPHQKLPEDPIKLAGILISYLRPAIVEHLLHILQLLTESNTNRETLLRHTSRFCQWVGQEQLAILEETLGRNEADSIKDCFRKFKSLSEDLRSTGEFLSPLALEAKQNGHEVTLRAAETIKNAWLQVAEQFDAEGIVFEGPDEDFSLPVARADLFLSALRVMQWMAVRKDRTPTGSQKISVEYAKGDNSVQIIFTDQSRRLGENLRRMLFEPFTQANSSPPPKEKEEDSRPGVYLPLFLAKMLVEVKYKGSLRDRTDELETPNGHRFVMSFPEGEETSA